MRRLVLAVLVFTLPSCSDGPQGVQTRAPVVHTFTVEPGPHNVLSAVVSAAVSDADSVAVEYVLTAHAAERTPAVVPVNGAATIPVLGLRAESTYAVRVLAFGAGVVHSETLPFTTAALPDDLPSFIAAGPQPSPGFVAFAAAGYGIVIDNDGRVVWYRAFADGPGLNFQAQPNGRYTARPPAPVPEWVELDILGNVTRRVDCMDGLTPRFHDAIARADGSWWLLCDETRVMDLSADGGAAAASVLGTVVQHIGADGVLQFSWSTFDHFAITDLPLEERTGALVNWTHANAIDLDDDGNLLLSFRSLNEITKVDTRTGAVLWRLGGVANQFTFLDTPLPAFARQHGARFTGSGRVQLLDNLGKATESRAERYVIDETTRTARLEQSYGSEPPVVAQLGGTTQPLLDGRMLVSFGNGARVEEYDAQGNVVWRLESPGYVFRAQRITSLYQPGAGTTR